MSLTATSSPEIVCDYCGEGGGTIRNISTTSSPFYIHDPPCPAMWRRQDQLDRDAREAAQDLSRNHDVKARWK